MFRLACLFLLLAAPARADVLWHPQPTADDPGRWDELQSAAANGQGWSRDRICAVPSPVSDEHRLVLRVELKHGDVTYNPRHWKPVPLGNRSELVHFPYLEEGTERWYHWRIYFPKDFVVTDGKGGGAVFAQWHHWNITGEPGSPPLLFSARENDIRLLSVPELNSQEAITLASVPQKKGCWRDIVFHVIFSSDPKIAKTELWVDHKPVPTRSAATLFPGYKAYLKMGLYRRPTAQEDNVVYFDDIIEGSTRGDVDPGSR